MEDGARSVTGSRGTSGLSTLNYLDDSLAPAAAVVCVSAEDN